MSKVNFDAFTIEKFQQKFNMNGNDFSTEDDKTHGKMTLTAGGRLVNWGRYDRGHTNYQALEGDGKAAKENYRVRYALVQALKNGKANEDWINSLKLGVGFDAEFDGNQKAPPLSRRTIKKILTDYKNQQNLEMTGVQPEESQADVDRSNVDKAIDYLEDINADLKSKDIGTMKHLIAATTLTEVVSSLSFKFNNDQVFSISSEAANAIIKHAVAQNKNVGKLLAGIIKSCTWNAANLNEAVKAIKILESNKQPSYQNSTVHKELCDAIIGYLTMKVQKNKGFDTVENVKEGAVQPEVKQGLKSDNLKKALKALEDWNDDKKLSGITRPTRIAWFVDQGLEKIAKKMPKDVLEKLTREEAEAIIRNQIEKKTSLGMVLESAKETGALKTCEGYQAHCALDMKLFWDAAIKYF